MDEWISMSFSLFACLGGGVFVLAIIDVVYNVLNGIKIHFLSSGVNLKEKFGEWAVVTGCTDGIGQAYAHELARRGINIVLISRNMDKLKKTAADIESQHSVKTKVIAVNLSEGKTSVEAVKKQFPDETIGILVNNVGCLTKYPKYLPECSEEELWEMVNVNVGFTTLLTRLILPGMVERRKGAIVNVSSMSEIFPWPLFNVYAATKVYVKHFTEGLRTEFADSGVTFQRLSPGLVATKLTDFSKEAQQSFMATDPVNFARYAVKTLGVTDFTTGYWKHGVQYYVANRLCPGLILKPMGLNMSKTLRKAYFEQESLTHKED